MSTSQRSSASSTAKSSSSGKVQIIPVTNVKKLQVLQVESKEELKMNYHSKTVREGYNQRKAKRESTRWPFLDNQEEVPTPKKQEDSLFVDTVYKKFLGEVDRAHGDIPLQVSSKGRDPIVKTTTRSESGTFFNDDDDDDDDDSEATIVNDNDSKATFFNDNNSEVDETEVENHKLHTALRQLVSAQIGLARKRFRKLEGSLDQKANIEFVSLCHEQKLKRYDPMIYTRSECREQAAHFRQQLNNLRTAQDKQSDEKREDLVRDLLMKWDTALVKFLEHQGAVWADVQPLLKKTQIIDQDTLAEIQSIETQIHREAKVEDEDLLERFWRLRFG